VNGGEGVNWKTVGQTGKGKCNEEIENKHKFSFVNPEKKRQVRKSKRRWNVKDIVVN
jgi:hypothetical protein